MLVYSAGAGSGPGSGARRGESATTSQFAKAISLMELSAGCTLLVWTWSG